MNVTSLFVFYYNVNDFVTTYTLLSNIMFILYLTKPVSPVISLSLCISLKL